MWFYFDLVLHHLSLVNVSTCFPSADICSLDMLFSIAAAYQGFISVVIAIIDVVLSWRHVF